MILRALFVLVLVLCSLTANAQELVLRHSLEGGVLDSLATLVVRFNDAQKGKARVVLEDANGVEDKQRLPHMAFLDAEDGMAMFGTLPRYRPLAQVMRESGEKFDPARFYPQVANAIDDLTGKIQALPLGLTLPVLFYNRDAFRKAGLDPAQPPRTWWEVQQAAADLLEAGYPCPLTSSRFSWVHVENLSSQHGEPLVAKIGRTDTAAFNSMVNIKHIALLSSWFKSAYFHYFGPGSEGDGKFATGECAMLTGESALYARLAKQHGFPLGIAVLPHYDDVYGVRPTQVLPDGVALWVLAADKKPEQQVIARFIAFLLKPEIQSEWVRATGYLPMSPAAVQALRAAGGDAAVLERAERRLSMPKRDAARTKIGFERSRIRAILNEEIEFVWGNRKPAKEALDTAVMRVGPVSAPAAESTKTAKR